ncbi:hypothetical protein pdam_00014317 [Pocillopora damicornis]|uniref:Uncharacterized protein n=1 Tax=Pocillopora damicornis TaxID=46731 RepID=A0A3M6U529_POCDA|nr:hypothetical protein pdam_00014317 [Pocillopora damicornis]
MEKTGVFLQIGSGICPSCRKTPRLLIAEEKESTAIVSSNPRSIDAIVLMQTEKLNLLEGTGD